MKILFYFVYFLYVQLIADLTDLGSFLNHGLSG